MVMNFMYSTAAVNYRQKCEIVMKPIVYIRNCHSPPPPDFAEFKSF
jgi:hypothetical protein